MTRYAALKGDLGYRIYDRKTKRHLKRKLTGRVAWYETKAAAERAIARLQEKYA